MKISSVNSWFFVSLLIGILVLFASLSGILYPVTYVQETANWALQAVGQDIGNLIAVPVLLASAYLLRNHSQKAALIWLGTLLYLIYAYVIYAFFIHFNFLFLVYVSILGLSFYTLIAFLIKYLGELKEGTSKQQLRFPSIILILIGGMFSFLWLSEVVQGLLSRTVPQSAFLAGLIVNPIHVIDLSVVLPGMIMTGVFLWQRKTLGYVFAAPWLMFSVLMGSSIVANMVLELLKVNLQAIIPFTLVGLIVILSMVALVDFLRRFRKEAV